MQAALHATARTPGPGPRAPAEPGTVRVGRLRGHPAGGALLVVRWAPLGSVRPGFGDRLGLGVQVRPPPVGRSHGHRHGPSHLY